MAMLCKKPHFMTSHFTIAEPQSRTNTYFYAVQKLGSVEFEALKT